MKRDPAKLADKEFDLVIVGGGIYGICAAWDAALRGLSVAIVDRGDFCGATSANPLKIVHGGFRYIQAANFSRIRASSFERNVLMRTAPHLVDPLPFFIPTYGHGMRGKEALTLGLTLYKLIVPDRNRGQGDPQKHIPWGQLFSREECLRLFPALDDRGLTGGLAFYDAQMYSPPRLGLCYLRSAVDAGAEAANYVEVTGFIHDRGRVAGVRARDSLSGEELEVRGKVVLNASGPWTDGLLRHLNVSLRRPLPVTKDLYLVVNRVLSYRYALAVPSRHREPTAIVSRGMRHFFIIPWRGRSLIGSSHALYEGSPDDFSVTEQDIHGLLNEVNEAYPSIGLTMDDVATWNSGLVPFGDFYGEHSRIIDHAREHGLEGLVSVVGVRYTTSRGVAKRAVELVLSKMGKGAPRSTTDETPIYGGRFEGFDGLLHEAVGSCPTDMSVEAVRSLLRGHGSEYRRVLMHLDEDRSLAETVGESATIKAQVVHAVREEMAQKLGDIVFRRTDVGSTGDPGESTLRDCAAVMAAELGWDQMTAERELDQVRKESPWPSRVYS